MRQRNDKSFEECLVHESKFQKAKIEEIFEDEMHGDQ
jgi:hypothetical protein